jgi:CDP-diacylglycerol--glycerol-3-phosphate 3-phosphatidyltransferase
MSTATTPTPRSPAGLPILKLPNQLTALRFFLALGLFLLIALELWIWSLAVFAVAAFTDWLDGYLARKLQLGSTLGRNLDPLVDKILVCGAFICLLPFGYAATGLYAWMVVVVVSRELVVTGLRGFIETRGGQFGAAWPGKLKMVLQCAAVSAIFFHLGWGIPQELPWSAWLRDILIWATLASTIHSGVQYLFRATILLQDD